VVPRKVVIDTDPGVDDALALMLALNSPELDVQAVTVVGGNVGLERCVRNAAGVVAMMGRDVPVAAGCARPLVREPVRAEHVHGEDGVGGAAAFLPLAGASTSTPAAELILEVAERSPGEVTLITLGPLTNAATALRADRELFRVLRDIVILGGAFFVPGNVTASAEFNIHADPHAAREVLASGVPVRMIGLDVTHQVVLTRECLLASTDGSFVRRAALHYIDFTLKHSGVDGCYLHDPLAVGEVIDPTVLRYRPLRTEVEDSGRTVVGMGQPNVLVAMSVDAERFMELFAERVLLESNTA
jgi:purine nucleosidase